jgi:hypothetical protein
MEKIIIPQEKRIYCDLCGRELENIKIAKKLFKSVLCISYFLIFCALLHEDPANFIENQTSHKKDICLKCQKSFKVWLKSRLS